MLEWSASQKAKQRERQEKVRKGLPKISQEKLPKEARRTRERRRKWEQEQGGRHEGEESRGKLKEEQGRKGRRQG